MSKRWKFRKRNAEKRERSREIMNQFYGNVISEIERIAAMPADERERLIAIANGERPQPDAGAAPTLCQT